MDLSGRLWNWSLEIFQVFSRLGIHLAKGRGLCHTGLKLAYPCSGFCSWPWYFQRVLLEGVCSNLTRTRLGFEVEIPHSCLRPCSIPEVTRVRLDRNMGAFAKCPKGSLIQESWLVTAAVASSPQGVPAPWDVVLVAYGNHPILHNEPKSHFPQQQAHPLDGFLLLWLWEVHLATLPRSLHLGKAFRLEGNLPQHWQGDNFSLFWHRAAWQQGHSLWIIGS